MIHPACRVPNRLQEQFDTTLSDMVRNEIITNVTEPTEWVNPIVTVRKPSGALRICLDQLELNKAIRREHYSIPTPGEIVSKLHGAQYFSTLDATSGFLQIPLGYASSCMTTFARPSGRYRCLGLPFGIKSAPEVFHRTIVEMFHDIEGVETYNIVKRLATFQASHHVVYRVGQPALAATPANQLLGNYPFDYWCFVVSRLLPRRRPTSKYVFNVIVSPAFYFMLAIRYIW